MGLLWLGFPVCLLRGMWEQVQQRLVAWLASPFKLNTGEFRVFSSLFHYSSLFLESSCTKSFVRIQFVVSGRVAGRGLDECSSVLCKPQVFCQLQRGNIRWVQFTAARAAGPRTWVLLPSWAKSSSERSCNFHQQQRRRWWTLFCVYRPS